MTDYLEDLGRELDRAADAWFTQPRRPRLSRFAIPAVAVAAVAATVFAVAQPGSAPERQATPAPAPAAPVATTRVKVLNGTTITGLATQTIERLRNGGFRVAGPDNFTDQARSESEVRYTNDVGTARAVAEFLRIGSVSPAGANLRALSSAPVTVILGADLAPPHVGGLAVTGVRAGRVALEPDPAANSVPVTKTFRVLLANGGDRAVRAADIRVKLAPGSGEGAIVGEATAGDVRTTGVSTATVLLPRPPETGEV